MATPVQIRQLDAHVYGIVQGVFFRFRAAAEADRLGISGAVENLPDGSVSVRAQGPEDVLQVFLTWLTHGPELAVVDRVDATWTDPDHRQSGFQIVR